jgi:hypothetical protein
MYFLTGSMASNYWGIPRATHDLDFVVQLASESVAPLVREFETDYYIDEVAVRAAFHPPYQFNALDIRSALKIDFWMLKAEPFDVEMFGRRARFFSENRLGSRQPRTSSSTNSIGTGLRHLIDSLAMRRELPPFKRGRSIQITCDVGGRRLASE